MNFDEETGDILNIATSEKGLAFKSKNGNLVPAKPVDTLLASNSTTTDKVEQYVSEIKVAGLNPINSRVRLPNGCPKCKTKVVAFILLGDDKKRVHSCPRCQHYW